MRRKPSKLRAAGKRAAGIAAALEVRAVIIAGAGLRLGHGGVDSGAASWQSRFDMRMTLVPHPETPCEAVRGIAVEVSRSGTKLDLGFRVEGDIGQIALPERGPRGRADDLWKHTCFEVFARAGQGYGEINVIDPQSRRSCELHWESLAEICLNEEEARVLNLGFPS